MSYSLRPAITSEAKPLIGLYSESGAGKTKSALLLAKGFCPDMSKVAIIETEAGRGEVYAQDPVVGGYQVRPIRDNFAPVEYGKALSDLEKAGIQVAIIDSASHEWEGAGGVLGWAAKNQEEGKKAILVWQAPKMSHQRDFILRLLQTPVPLVIVCMRAKYPMKEVVKNGKKEWTRSEELEPKQADDILFEMMVHGWIDKDHKFHGTKYTTDDFRNIFIDSQPISVETGKKLAIWAKGEPAKQTDNFPLKIGTDLRTQVDDNIKAANIPADRFIDWLVTIGKVKIFDGKPELASMTSEDAGKMLKAWTATIAAFNKWNRPVMAPAECPDEPGTFRAKTFCEKCTKYSGCPSWS